MATFLPPVTLLNTSREVLVEVWNERESQDKRWGQQDHPDGTEGNAEEWKTIADLSKRVNDNAYMSGIPTFKNILKEEVAEAFAETDPVLIRAELVQVAAVAVAWIEAIDRRLLVR